MIQSTIKCWAEDDRPREKLIQKGRSVLTDAELIAILIGSGNREHSAVDLARIILADCENNLHQLSKKSVKDFMKYKGIGEAKAVSIYAALELSRRRIHEEHLKENSVHSSMDSYNELKSSFIDLDHEQFYVLFLSRSNKILGKEQISRGGLSGTVADGKIIFQKALEMKSSAIILAHNHPSGQLKPSQADIRLTKQLVDFGKLIDLHILDHLIITDNNYFSFADEGMLN